MTIRFRRVVLESPLAGKSRWVLVRWLQVWANRRYARQCARDCLLRSDAPFASHLIYAQAGILDDTVPWERDWGIKAGFAWLQSAQASVVYIDRGISKGMNLGIQSAKAAGIPVEFRSLKYKKARDLEDAMARGLVGPHQ